MIKLLAIDMDGTLLDEEKKIPQANKEALHLAAAKGVEIVLCTGRPQSGVVPYYEELDLPGQEEYAILNNGCSTHRAGSWEVLSHVEISRQEIRDLADLVAAYPEVYLTLITPDYYYVQAETVPDLVAYDASLVFDEAVAISLDKALSLTCPVFQVMFLAEKSQLDLFQAAEEEGLAKRFSVVRSQPYIFEIMPQGVTKASALADLAQSKGYEASQVMTVGDGNNDIEMLTYAGIGVAMGNGTEAVKAAADFVTASNDQAGLAQAIHDHILNPK